MKKPGVNPGCLVVLYEHFYRHIAVRAFYGEAGWFSFLDFDLFEVVFEGVSFGEAW